MKIACLVGLSLLICLSAHAQSNSYSVTPIVDSTVDEFLINPWGLSRSVDPGLGENQWWVSDNATGFTTLYFANKTGIDSLAPLIISVPPATGSGPGSPTGTVYNGTGGPGPGTHNFTYATLDGTISNWNSGEKPLPGGHSCMRCHVTTTTIKVNRSTLGASYTGLTIATNRGKPTYYAANFNGSVEGYDATTFRSARLRGTFSDPRIPSDYKPYGIQTIGDQIWVTFFNEVSGGFVDSFDFNGKRKVRLANGAFSEPWGIAQAPANFGAFSNMILVSNTTSGMIGAYNATTGAFQDFLRGANGNPIALPGIWGISFGNGHPESGPTNTLYYSTGGENEDVGEFGEITAN